MVSSTESAKEKATKQKPETSYSSPPQRLYRSSTNRVIAGVAGGLGEYFSVDPTIIRLLFVLTAIFGGSGFLVYIVLWIITPEESDTFRTEKHPSRRPVQTMSLDEKNKADKKSSGTRRFIGILLLVLGAAFLLQNFGIFDISAGKLWPLWLILGGYLVLKHR